MSSDVQNNNSISLSGVMAMPVIQTTFSGLHAIKTHGGIKKAIKAQNHSLFNDLNQQMKDNGLDVFTRSQNLALSYDSYKTIETNVAKAEKKLAKLNKKGKDVSAEFLEDLSKKRIALNNANNSIQNLNNSFTIQNASKVDDILSLSEIEKIAANGVETSKRTAGILEKTAEEAIEYTAKATVKSAKNGFKSYVKQNFKNELGLKHGKLNYVMTALQFIPNVMNEVIPAFKEEGIWAGIKATGKTLLRGAADLVGYAAGGSLGRAIGATIGTVIAPGVGSKVGAAIGDMVGSMLIGTTVTSSVDKLVGADKKDVSLNQNNTQLNNQPTEIDLASLPSADEIKKLAYQSACQNIGGSNMHTVGYYA